MQDKKLQKHETMKQRVHNLKKYSSKYSNKKFLIFTLPLLVIIHSTNTFHK